MYAPSICTSSTPVERPTVLCVSRVPVTSSKRPSTDADIEKPTATIGTLGRNQIRQLGAWQQDFALRREFPIRENLKLQFRAEAFNIFNHPNFGTMQRTLGAANFGQTTAMLNNALGGGLNAQFQIGGPRSGQFALKLIF